MTSVCEREARTAQSMYWSCHDAIRTQILNRSESWRNHQSGTAVRVQPGQKTAGLCPVLVTNPPRHSGLGLWLGLDQNQTKAPVKTQTAGEFPGPVGNTTANALMIIGDPVDILDGVRGKSEFFKGLQKQKVWMWDMHFAIYSLTYANSLSRRMGCASNDRLSLRSLLHLYAFTSANSLLTKLQYWNWIQMMKLFCLVSNQKTI